MPLPIRSQLPRRARGGSAGTSLERRLPLRVLRLEIVEPVSEAVAPALPGRLPAELPLRLRVRGAADLRHQRDGNLACGETTDPDRYAHRRLGADRVGQVR